VLRSLFEHSGDLHRLQESVRLDDHAATRIAADVYTRLTDHGTGPSHTARAALALSPAVRHTEAVSNV
jgi:hypothetical protein